MELRGRLFQEAPNNTIGYSDCSMLADKWLERQFYADNLTGTYTFFAGHGAFSNLFEKVRLAPVYKFQYFTRADELASLAAHALPLVTGPAAIDLWQDFGQIDRPVGTENRTNIGVQLQEMTSWLNVTYDELADMIGVGRSTLFHWRRGEGMPRPTNLRNINRLYSLSSLLAKRLGVRGAQAWLDAGPDRPRDYLTAGDLQAVEDQLRAQLFHQANSNYAQGRAIADEDALPPLAQPQKLQFRRVERPSRRGRPLA